MPNEIVKDMLKINPLAEDDFEMVLYHAPGETNDQIIAWLPKHRILFPADNIYKVWNKYQINWIKDMKYDKFLLLNNSYKFYVKLYFRHFLIYMQYVARQLEILCNGWKPWTWCEI